MNHYSLYELCWLFFVYSFAGWILETILTVWKQRKFANRGLVNGPLCVVYGIAGVLMAVGLREMTGVWLFVFACVYATTVEWAAGHLLERVFRERWWDYSDRKWNLDGYICLTMSLCWGALGTITVRWGNTLVLRLISVFPGVLMQILLLILLLLLAVDVLASYLLLKGRGNYLPQLEAANEQIDQVSVRLRKRITDFMEHRIQKAYPEAAVVEMKPEVGEEPIFAAGCGFYKIVMLFFAGAFLGDLTETVFCRITAGVWMSRSSVVWGPFSIVWGLAIALGTAMLYKYKDRSDRFLFVAGTLLGGGYEYLCSVFTEIVFGKVFWDYSQIPFNLGGRINLLYCFFWGIAGVVWFKMLYPKLSQWIEKLPVKCGKSLTWLLILFMICNVAVSCMALIRYEERDNGIPAEQSWQQWVDTHYDDAKMERIYPNAKSAS